MEERERNESFIAPIALATATTHKLCDIICLSNEA